MDDDKIQQAALLLELAEHHYLRALGWLYGHFPECSADFCWKAPLNHQGSSRFYLSRGHAINSVRRWMGLRRETNPVVRRGTRSNVRHA